MNKRWQQAVDTYKKGLEISPNDDVLRQNYEYALRQLAEEQRKEIQKQQQAVDALKAALRKHPNNAEIRKNYESAKADLEAKQAKLAATNPQQAAAPAGPARGPAFTPDPARGYQPERPGQPVCQQQAMATGGRRL